MLSKTLDETIEHIRADYVNMPGLALSFRQAPSFWNLPEELCELALVKLVRAGFLMRTTSGRYIRRAEPPAVAVGPPARRIVPGMGERGRDPRSTFPTGTSES